MEEITLLFDVKQKRPGCALLQALAGCNSHDLWNVGFDTDDWLLAPTPDMCRIRGTKEEWKRFTEQAHKEASSS